jgi:hypothetical protein
MSWIRIHTSDKWIRIREAQKHADPADPDPAPDTQHWFSVQPTCDIQLLPRYS